MERMTTRQANVVLAVLHRIEHRQLLVLRMLRALGAVEVQTVEIGQQLLDLAAKQATTVQSIVTLIQGLQSSGQVSADAAQQILAAFQGNEDKLEAVLQPAPPPPPPPAA